MLGNKTRSITYYVFMGLPGSGKGTFSKLICDKFGWHHLSLGDLLRNSALTNPQLAADMAKGILISDSLANQIVAATLDNQTTSVILDGYPRNVSQAEALFRLCQNKSIPTKAIHIDLAETVVKAKLLGRRECKTCRQSFNLADVMSDGYDMPAILPRKETCKLRPQECKIDLVCRADDTPEDKNMLINFEVKKGIADTDRLIEVMLKRA